MGFVAEEPEVFEPDSVLILYALERMENGAPVHYGLTIHADGESVEYPLHVYGGSAERGFPSLQMLLPDFDGEIDFFRWRYDTDDHLHRSLDELAHLVQHEFRVWLQGT
jgi:hypothetical protein